MITDEKLKEDIQTYINNFVTERFPSLTKKLEPVIREIVFDAFIDGIKYAEVYADKNTSRIIQV